MARRLRRPAGFTLIELLVTMSIIAILAGILVPTIIIARRSAKRVATHNLLEQINAAIVNFSRDWGSAPPDRIPAGTQLVKFRKPASGTKSFSLGTQATGSESLFYFLTNPGAGGSPWQYNEDVQGDTYLELQAEVQHTGHYDGGQNRYVDDYNSNQIPEIIDSWGRPFLYNRPPFPSADYSGRYNLTNFDNGVNADHMHNSARSANPFDLFSVGPDGQTSNGSSLPSHKTSLASYESAALSTSSTRRYGEGPDDIKNW